MNGFYFKAGLKASEVFGILGNRASHAIPLEFKPQSMGGRPFMRPLYKRWKGRITKTFRKNIGVVVKDG